MYRLFLLLCVTTGLLGCQNAVKQMPDRGAVHNPKAAEINMRLGLSYMKNNNMLRARQKLLLALQQDEKSAENNNAMAYFLESTGDIAEAEKFYRRALAIDPKKGQPNNNYGGFLCRQKKYAEAEKYFITAINDHDYLNVTDAYENAAVCALQIPDIDRAENYFKQVLAQDNDRPKSLSELAKIAFKKQDYKAADEYLRHALALGVTDAEVDKLTYQLAQKLGKNPAAYRYNVVSKSAPQSNPYKEEAL